MSCCKPALLCLKTTIVRHLGLLKCLMRSTSTAHYQYTHRHYGAFRRHFGWLDFGSLTGLNKVSDDTHVFTYISSNWKFLHQPINTSSTYVDKGSKKTHEMSCELNKSYVNFDFDTCALCYSCWSCSASLPISKVEMLYFLQPGCGHLCFQTFTLNVRHTL